MPRTVIDFANCYFFRIFHNQTDVTCYVGYEDLNTRTPKPESVTDWLEKMFQVRRKNVALGWLYHELNDNPQDYSCEVVERCDFIKSIKTFRKCYHKIMEDLNPSLRMGISHAVFEYKRI